MKFLIQELKTDQGAARFYLRLEKDGVFQGWAIPKALTLKEGEKRLALEVGPFPLKAETFEGPIKKSKFGPGKLFIRDRGEVRSRLESDSEIIVDLSGSHIRGTYKLSRYAKKGPDAWIISRTTEPAPPQKRSQKKSKKPKPSRSNTPKNIKPAPAKKKRSSRQKYRKWKSQNRPKARLTSRFPQKMKTREGRLVGWIYMGIIILIIYGLIQLIKYIGTLI